MNNFRLNVVVRVIMIFGFSLAAYYLILETPFWLLGGWMILFFILSLASLVLFVEKSERDLSNFLLAIKQNDFTNTYPQTRQNKKRLYHAFNIITEEFIKIRGEKESNFHFLQTVVEHSGVPLMAYEVGSGDITMVNQSAHDLFRIPHFTRLNSLSRVGQELVEKIRGLGSDQKILLKVDVREESFYLSIVAKELVLQGKKHKVVAFHNINNELDQKEVESWQKLIRVLTHEIKNSVIPISTLAEVINDMFKDLEQNQKSITELEAEDVEDLTLSIKTIEKRSKGLVKFVTSYGDLAKVPKPEFASQDLVELTRDILTLEDKFIKNAGVHLIARLPTSAVQVQIDKEMIEQVLINLVKNAIEAMIESKVEHPTLEVSLDRHAQGCSILVADNGPGIDQEILDNIFVPFFTTKKEGSGIGLSLSKQIMRAHRGNIRVRSKAGSGTTFELSF